MPPINYISNSFGLYGNIFKEFGVRMLGVIKSSLGIANNPTLANISLPSLLSIGFLRIENNTKVKTINGFAQLGTIGGPLNLSGNFSQYSPLGLRRFTTAMLTGTYSCQGSYMYPSATTSSVSTTSAARLVLAENPSGGLSAGAKAGIGVGVSLGIIGLAAVVFLHRRKQKLKLEGKEYSIKKDGKPVADLGGGE